MTVEDVKRQFENGPLASDGFQSLFAELQADDMNWITALAIGVSGNDLSMRFLHHRASQLTLTCNYQDGSWVLLPDPDEHVS